tara:strand:+ start:54 stop:1010 length:957 start_codon:yes stop_codon:yes gene_type:complete
MMKQLTGLSRDRYALRRIALDQVDSVIQEHAITGTKVPSRVKRIYNIINQSDPDDLFGHLTEKQLRGYVFGEKPLPKYLSGRGKSGSPDAKLFKEERRFFGEEIHHKNPLAQNTNAINPEWKDNDLFVFHNTLREAQTGAGSTRLGLIGLIKDEHTGRESIHADLGGTKVPAFAALEQTDPELAAGEFLLNNFKNSEAARWWTNERGKKTMQVLDAPEGSPLQQALIQSKGIRRNFDTALQMMNGGIHFITKPIQEKAQDIFELGKSPELEEAAAEPFAKVQDPFKAAEAARERGPKIEGTIELGVSEFFMPPAPYKQ